MIRSRSKSKIKIRIRYLLRRVPFLRDAWRSSRSDHEHANDPLSVLFSWADLIRSGDSLAFARRTSWPAAALEFRTKGDINNRYRSSADRVWRRCPSQAAEESHSSIGHLGERVVRIHRTRKRSPWALSTITTSATQLWHCSQPVMICLLTTTEVWSAERPDIGYTIRVCEVEYPNEIKNVEELLRQEAGLHLCRCFQTAVGGLPMATILAIGHIVIRGRRDAR